jgi:hypothetical protein
MTKFRRRQDDPLVQWMAANKPDKHTDRLIDSWLEAAIAPEEALEIEEQFEAWLKDRSRPAPDLVACVAWYGYARLLIQGWTKIPIDIPDDDLDRWRQASYLPTIRDFQERLAGVAGGFLELAGYAPPLTVSIMSSQLKDKLDQLDEFANLPLEHYTPREMTDDQIEDGDDSYEQHQFDRPFVLRQQLECFEWAMEKYRMLAISEQSPEVGLPNRELHEALMQIDLNELLARLQAVDVKLRRVLQHLAEHDYYRLNSDIAPQRFWWRHWSQVKRKRSKRS